MKKIKVKHIAATMLTLTVISGILFSGIKNMRVRAMPEAGSTEVARQISDESIVLLKNSNQVLPLKMGSNIALFGDAQVLAYKIQYVDTAAGVYSVLCGLVFCCSWK